MGDDPSDPENNAPNVNGPGDTIMEIWNLVFMQFDRSRSRAGQIQTRRRCRSLRLIPAWDWSALAVVLQGVKSNYETDLLRPIVEFTAKLAGRNYEAGNTGRFCHARDRRPCARDRFL